MRVIRLNGVIVCVLCVLLAGVCILYLSGLPGRLYTHFRGNVKDTPPRVSVVFLGDILLAQRNSDSLFPRANRNMFSAVRAGISSYDHIVANMETPVTTRGESFPDKRFVFRITRERADAVKSLNPSCLLTGNNHIMDYGYDGMSDTIAWIRSMGWFTCGAGVNAADARHPLILGNGKARVAILSYSECSPNAFYATTRKGGSAFFDIDAVKEDIRKLTARGLPVVVCVHWGWELTDNPQSYQRIAAGQLIDEGASAVIGYHPHCVQGIELIRGHPVFYSLGDLANSFVHTPEWNSIAAGFVFEGNRLVRAEIIPLAGTNDEKDARIIPLRGIEASRLITRVNALSSQLGTKIRTQNGKGIIDLR
jgi:poly-gamma-glutamate capsule biosynthesis protein CapA/YwtB (metallophosphatase superfamily)